MRSVGNSAKLKQTALVEAFNLKAAIELELHNPVGAAAALSDMPPRQEQELDPVTLHNQAVISIAQGERTWRVWDLGWCLPAAKCAAGRQQKAGKKWHFAPPGTMPCPCCRNQEHKRHAPQTANANAAGVADAEAAGMDKLVHLLEHPPFPGTLLCNLLSLVCRPGREMPGVAEQVLQDHAEAVERHVPKVGVGLRLTKGDSAWVVIQEDPAGQIHQVFPAASAPAFPT